MATKTTKPKAKSSKKATKPNAKSSKKTTSAKTAKSPKKLFGGYAINFVGRKDTVEQVFGKKPIPPSEMTKRIWAYVKANKLSTK